MGESPDLEGDSEPSLTMPEEEAEESTSRRVPASLAARYTDIKFVGEGGMATVYRAFDPRLHRFVALKLLKAGDATRWNRFRAEARTQAHIAHENICRVYEAGESDGEPFIVMQYIDGSPLSTAAQRLTLRQRIRVMVDVAGALHEAHKTGMIHRDIKPSNILVETREDGPPKPYVVDFGLAREVEDRGLTQTGAILGTPAYMAPEQARGRIQEMDRRSDVYSLGATLYELLAGQPPFVAEHPWALLMKVATEEPPPLREVIPNLPEDLETITMKCLEHDPDRRYESARALAEDLQRFLDGDPVHARKASAWYVLRKKARKHRLATGLLALVLVTALVTAGLWLREQRRSAQRARLAQNLGEELTKMELFLRAAYQLPEHDIERERDMVRGRLRRIEELIAALGPAAAGPGAYALGQGHLTLGEPEAALVQLEKAVASDYQSPELEYALGRTKGELFRRSIEDTRRISNKAERARQVARLEEALRDPALVHLRRAVATGLQLDAPAYVEGLLALYAGNHEEAAAKAALAFEQAPWMYEAKKLLGDALFAEGSKYRHDAAFDYDRMMAHFEPAARAYQDAADIGRSDPHVHLAECELWEKAGQAAGNKALPFDAAFDSAEAACDRAARASSKDHRAAVQRALVLSARLHFSVEGPFNESTPALSERALRAAGEAVRRSPDDVMAHYSYSLALQMDAKVAHRLGRMASMEPVIAAYGKVLSLDPQFAWALSALGDAHLFEASEAFASGRDGADYARRAIERYEQAIAVDPSFVLPAGGRLKALSLEIEADVERGRDAAPRIDRMFDAVARLDTAFGAWLSAFWRARTHLLRASHELSTGKDPRPSIEDARRAITSLGTKEPGDYWLLIALARCGLIQAQYELEVGLDPRASVAQALGIIARARDLGDRRSQAILLTAARLHAVSLRASLARGGGANAADLASAFDTMNMLLAIPNVDANGHQVAAELFALRAEQHIADRSRARADIEAGLAMVAAALAKNPRAARAFRTSARLHLLRGRVAGGAKERAAEARLAAEAFEASYRENPSFAARRGADEREAGVLLR